MDKERIVFLVGGYYPTFSPPGVCAEKIVAHLKNAYDIDIVCWRRSWQVPEAAFCHDGVHIFQVSDWINDRLLSAPEGKRRFWRMVRFLFAAMRLEDTTQWTERAMLKALFALDSERPIQRIVSVGFPTQTHSAAQAFVGMRTGIRWVTYSTDTHHGNRSGKRFLRKFRERRERNCYVHADMNFFSREIYTTCAGFLGPEVMEKAHMLDYMIDLRTFSAKEPPVRSFSQNEITLVFGGAFVENVRSPEYVLRVLRELPQESRICWHVFSDIGFRRELQDFATECPNRLLLHHAIGLDEFRDVMRGSDVLVNVSNDLDQFFPSKVFEYIATGRPVVDFIYPRRKTNAVFERYPMYLPLRMDGNPREDALRLADFCQNHCGRRLALPEITSLYGDYLPENALKAFIRSLE